MDFKKEFWGNVVVEIVNLKRATYIESEAFGNILERDITEGKLKLVIDLSLCEFIDPIFTGKLIMTTRKILNLGGRIAFVKPNYYTRDGISAENIAFRVFSIFNTRKEAVLSLGLEAEGAFKEAIGEEEAGLLVSG